MSPTRTTTAPSTTAPSTTAPSSPALSQMSDPAAEAAIQAAARALALPTVRDHALAIADAAAKQRLTHKAFLAEVLSAECDERDARRRLRRVNEAKLKRPRFDAAPV